MDNLLNLPLDYFVDTWPYYTYSSKSITSEKSVFYDDRDDSSKNPIIKRVDFMHILQTNAVVDGWYYQTGGCFGATGSKPPCGRIIEQTDLSKPYYCYLPDCGVCSKLDGYVEKDVPIKIPEAIKLNIRYKQEDYNAVHDVLVNYKDECSTIIINPKIKCESVKITYSYSTLVLKKEFSDLTGIVAQFIEKVNIINDTYNSKIRLEKLVIQKELIEEFTEIMNNYNIDLPSTFFDTIEIHDGDTQYINQCTFELKNNHDLYEIGTTEAEYVGEINEYNDNPLYGFRPYNYMTDKYINMDEITILTADTTKIWYVYPSTSIFCTKGSLIYDWIIKNDIYYRALNKKTYRKMVQVDHEKTD
jgi:hypothetical protein